MSDERFLGVALLGCGGMAAHYRDNYAELPGVAYRLVVDINAALAERTAAECGAQRWSTRWQDALADDIALVDISTPNHLHAEQAIACLNAGKHVLLQKPIAPTIVEGKRIADAATAAKRQAAVYISDFEDPAIWDMQTLVQEGYLGKVTGVRARYAHRGGLRARVTPENWRGSAAKTGGGAFIQLSIHHINVLQAILDERIASVMAYSANLACPNIEGDDVTTAVCVFERSGIQAVLESSWNSDGTSFEIYGTEGRVSQFGGQGGAIEVHANRPFAGRILRTGDACTARIPAYSSTDRQCRRENPLNQHVAFVEAVRAGLPFPVSLEKGLYDLAVCKAVYASAEMGRRVTIAEVLA